MEGSSQQPAIGIDLGTTYSCVAVWRNSQIEIMANDQGNRTTPSWVAFTETQRYIGEGAQKQAFKNYKNSLWLVPPNLEYLGAKQIYNENLLFC